MDREVKLTLGFFETAFVGLMVLFTIQKEWEIVAVAAIPTTFLAILFVKMWRDCRQVK